MEFVFSSFCLGTVEHLPATRNSSVERGHFIVQNVFYQNCFSYLENYIFNFIFVPLSAYNEVQGVLQRSTHFNGSTEHEACDFMEKL